MAGKKTGKRLLTWVLVLVMALSLLPLNALADEADEADALQMSDEDNSGDRSLMPAKTTYTITFDASGGKLNNGNETFDATYNSEKALVKSGDVANSNILDENPSNPPHVFQGWFYKQFNIGIKKEFKPQSTKVNDVVGAFSHHGTIYAKWKLPDGFKEASIFYLKDPTRNLDSNTGEDWRGPLGGTTAGFVDTTGFIWKQSATNASVENSMSVQPDDVTWPSGYGTPNKDGLKLDKNTDEWNDIFEAFKTKVEADNGVGSLTEDQVDSITLVPYKVSRGNQTYGNYHVDCDVVIKCNFVTVDFMVEDNPGHFASILLNGKITWPMNTVFPKGKAPAAPEKDGYEFDGWYTDGAYTEKADFTKPLTTDTTFYGKYTEKETPAPEPDDPKLDVNFKYEKNIVDVFCETNNNHNCSYRLKNGYYTMSDKKQLANGNWQCKITIDLAKYFELYNSDSQHPGHTRDMEHSDAFAFMMIYPTWYAKSGQWSCAERLIDPAKIYVKCNATPTEYIPVTLTANSKTVTYNGEEQTVNDYTSNAPEGVTFEGITATGSGINVGEYTVKFSDGAVGKTDTTGKYIVAKTVDGKLTINPLDVTVTIKGNTGTYEYDGTEKTVEGYTAKIDNNLYTEADFQLVGSQAKISASVPGTYQMGLKPENFKNTNPNFNVTFVVNPGKLTIENCPITITANDVTVKYDGRPHGENGYSITKGSLVNGHAATVIISGSETDAGEYEDLLVPSVTKIVDAKGNDVTSYYDISYEDGFLTINKRNVTLTSASDSKVCDGTPLTKPEVKVTGDGFADGEGATYNVTGTITNAGTVDNAFTYTLKDGTKASNYNITKKEGKLTITEASAPTPGTFDFNDVVYGDGKVTPAITKTVKGNVGRNFKESFEVTVKPKSDNAKNTMTTASYTGEAKVIASKSLKDVPFLFKPEVMAKAVVPYGELRFTEAGTYTYTVREEIPGKTSRMSYDTTEYTLTINVVLNKNTNKYEVEFWQFTAGNRENLTQLNIVNTYRTYHPSTPSKPTLNTGDHYAYVMGYPDGTVRPNGSITRAEVSAILFRLLSDKTRDEYFTTVSSFTDVKAGAWYNNSIATLEKAGVIVDTAKGGAFRPNEAITRAELAAMLAQFSDAKPVKGVKFSDVSAEHWAYEAIAIAAKMGWIEGYPDGTFRPDATITRAEMMTLVNRALERVPSDEDHLLSKRVMLTFPDCKSGDWFYIAVQEATNSHTYERAATEKNGDEQWTALRANRDWTQLEK